MDVGCLCLARFVSRTLSHVSSKLAHWLAGQGMVAAAVGLTVEAYRHGTSSLSEYQGVVEESGISVSSTSSKALKGLCLAAPKDLVHDTSINALAGNAVEVASCTTVRFHCSQSIMHYPRHLEGFLQASQHCHDP
jgi:hypothetical protein